MSISENEILSGATENLGRSSSRAPVSRRFRLLVVSQPSPRALCNGTGLRVHHLLRSIRHRHDVTLLCGDDIPCSPSIPTSLGQRIHSALRLDSPYPFVPEMQTATRQKIASRQFDAVLLFGAELLQYIDGCTIPIIADLVDDPVLATRRSLVELHGMAWLRSAKRCLTLVGYERRLCRQVNACLLVSEQEAASFSRITGLTSAVVVPNGVDVEFFRPQGLPVKRGEIVFSGSMGFHPNVAACEYFAKRIFPAILKDVPEAHWTIVGSDPHASIKALAKHPRIDVTGFVEDIRPYIEQAAVVVSPLISGGGIKNKVLEAWAMKKGIVATPYGCAGVDARGEENLLVATSPESFAEKTVRLLRNPEEARALGEAGYQTVVTKYSWEDQSAKLEQVLQSVLGRQK